MPSTRRNAANRQPRPLTFSGPPPACVSLGEFTVSLQSSECFRAKRSLRACVEPTFRNLRTGGVRGLQSDERIRARRGFANLKCYFPFEQPVRYGFYLRRRHSKSYCRCEPSAALPAGGDPCAPHSSMLLLFHKGTPAKYAARPIM